MHNTGNPNPSFLSMHIRNGKKIQKIKPKPGCEVFSNNYRAQTQKLTH